MITKKKEHDLLSIIVSTMITKKKEHDLQRIK